MMKPVDLYPHGFYPSDKHTILLKQPTTLKSEIDSLFDMNWCVVTRLYKLTFFEGMHVLQKSCLSYKTI